MANGSEQAQTGLEDRLRSMILKNQGSAEPSQDHGASVQPPPQSQAESIRKETPKQSNKKFKPFPVDQMPSAADMSPVPERQRFQSPQSRSPYASNGTYAGPNRQIGYNQSPSRPQQQYTPSQRPGYGTGAQPSPQRQHQVPNGSQGWRGPNQRGNPAAERRTAFMDQLARSVVPSVEMTADEEQERASFLTRLESICRSAALAEESLMLSALSMYSFGSLRSGFATQGADMDVVIMAEQRSTDQQQPVNPQKLSRVLEAELLHLGIGARLLGRARVPIIKVCERPGTELLEALRTERAKWDALPEDEKDQPAARKEKEEDATEPHPAANADENALDGDDHDQAPGAEKSTSEDAAIAIASTEETSKTPQTPAKTRKPWTREKVKGPLDFPKDGVGVQCDINFFNPLGLHNTHLLRCYSLCDPRVRPMVLFVKAWVKRRKINSSYSGTLSSYGYVLLVLHFLMNVARPPVVPNLQVEGKKRGVPTMTIEGWEIQYFADEATITQAAAAGTLSQNREPLGALLVGFFQYFAQNFHGQGFMWMKDAVSLRTDGGLLSKEEKGWTGAKTETTEQKEVRHRYLLAIEDPFELSHNVARTVTHQGIVAIRDEFRRAWRILGAIGQGTASAEGDLFDELQAEA